MVKCITLLHKIVDNFQHNTKTLLPSKEYNIFQQNNPKVIHLKIFGCPVYVHIPKEKITKLDLSGKKGISVGYCEVSKFFSIYIPGFHHMEISRDVTFDEAALKRSRKCHHEEVYEEDVPPRNVEAAPSAEDETPKDHDMLEPQEPHTMNMSRKRNIAC